MVATADGVAILSFRWMRISLLYPIFAAIKNLWLKTERTVRENGAAATAEKTLRCGCREARW